MEDPLFARLAELPEAVILCAIEERLADVGRLLRAAARRPSCVRRDLILLAIRAQAIQRKAMAAALRQGAYR